MEHIPKPLHSIKASIDVPLLTIIPYDFQGFPTFPNRHGFVKDGKLDLHRSVDDLASLLQSWLYFGLLAEYCRSPVNIDAFTHSLDLSEIGILVDSKALGDLRQQKLSFIKDLSEEELNGVDKSLFNCILCALDQIGIFDHHPCGRLDPIPTIVLSIKIMITTLLYLTPVDYGSIVHRLKPIDSSVPGNFSSPSSSLLVRKMRDVGWCPFRIARICQNYNYAVIYHLLQLERPNPRGINHKSCTERDCCANTVHEDEYITRHTPDACVCESPVEVPISDVKQIIKQGGIPLVSIHRTNGRLNLRVAKASASSHYVAISHVWSDGLGNPKSNSLPHCQVERLNEYISNLPSPHDRFSRSLIGTLDVFRSISFAQYSWAWRKSRRLFWLDTFCIPVTDQSLRDKAISQMAAIYAGAAEVLILDSEIQHLHIDDDNKENLLPYLPGCAWAGRCWTLQEGALSARCYLQTAEKAINPVDKKMRTSLDGPFSFRKDEYVPRSLPDVLLSRIGGSIFDEFLRSLRILDNNTKHPGGNILPMDVGSFAEIWNALSARSTSNKEDTFGIFANLLRFNAFYIMGRPSPAEKMRPMIYSLEDIPLSIFYNEGPRDRSNKMHNDRWLPILPMGSHLSLTPVLEQRPEGFRISSETIKDEDQGPCIISIESHIPQQCRWIILELSSRRYYVEIQRPLDDELDPSKFQGTCLVVEHPFLTNLWQVNGMIRGACLQINGHDQTAKEGAYEPGLHIKAVFDCPLRLWTEATGPTAYELPVLRGSVVTGTWSITIEHGPVTENDNLPRRFPLNYTNSFWPVLVAVMVLASCLLSSIGVFIAITAKTSRADMTPIWIVSRVFYFWGIFFVSFPVHLLIGIILFIVDRVKQHVAFSTLDITFLVLTFMYLPVAPLLLLTGLHYWNRYTYNQWLATFREGFRAGHKYRWLFKFFVWNKDLASWGEAKGTVLEEQFSRKMNEYERRFKEFGERVEKWAVT